MVTLQYRSYATSGADAEYFQGLAVDDDEDPAQYLQVKRPSRPLPEGNYEVSFRIQAPSDVPCNFFPDDFPLLHCNRHGPAGTVHEAFFDPITVGTAVKADGSNGVLKPTSFTVGGAATEITSLEWSNNQVVLTLDPHVSLSGSRVGLHRAGRQHISFPLHRRTPPWTARRGRIRGR